MLLNCDVGEDSWESFGMQRDPTSPSLRKSVLNIHWKDRCWSWNSSTLATWCKELTHLKRPWWWERLKAGGEGDDRGWDDWKASPTNGHEFGWTLGVGDGQEGLACCGSWGRKESDTNERLNWTELNSACRILVHWPRIEPLLTLGVCILNHWTTREVPTCPPSSFNVYWVCVCVCVFCKILQWDCDEMPNSLCLHRH